MITAGGFALLVRDRRAKEAPRLYVDMGSVRFKRGEKYVISPKPKANEWVHQMVATLVNVGPGTAYAVEFTISASGDSVETLSAEGEFVQVLAPGEERSMNTLFHTHSQERPAVFAYEPIKRPSLLDGDDREAWIGTGPCFAALNDRAPRDLCKQSVPRVSPL